MDAIIEWQTSGVIPLDFTPMRHELIAAIASDKWHRGARSTETRVAGFEASHGLALPADFRYLTLNIGGLEIHSRIYCDGRGVPQALVHLGFAYFGGAGSSGSVEGLHAEGLFNHPLDSVGQLAYDWITKLIPFVYVPGSGPLCFDFAYDSSNPPVVQLTQKPWPSRYPGVPIEYVAESVTDFLRLPNWDGESELEANCEPSEAAVRWTHWSNARLAQI